MSVDIATLGVEIKPRGITETTNQLDGLKRSGQQAETSTNKLSSSFSSLAGYIKAAAAAFATYKLAEYIKESAMLAARVETLGVVMKVVGANAGYTSSQMDAFTVGLKKMGITTQESMNSLIKMAGANMDLTKSAQLARVAQDAAVIGGINSSDAFGRMIQGIRSGETEILKTIGINVQFEQGYKKTAAALGKTTAELTSTEKTASRMNDVLGFGVNIAGAYESAMSTAGKTMSSLARPAEEIKLLIGSTFTPALNDSVRDLYGLLNDMTKTLENNKQILSDVGFWFKYIYFLGKTTVLELVNVWHLAELAANKFGEAVANALYLMQGGSLNGKNPFAGMVTWFAENTAAIKKDIIDNNNSVKKSWDDLANYGIGGRSAGQEQTAINASRLRKEAENKAAAQATAAEQRKAATEALKHLKDQQEAFYNLGQEIEKTSDSAARAFGIMTMGGGDLKTDRYKVTNPMATRYLGGRAGYSLLDNTPRSIAQDSAPPIDSASIDAFNGLQEELANPYERQLVQLKKYYDDRKKIIDDYAGAEADAEQKKAAATVALDAQVKDKKLDLEREKWSQVGGIVSGQLSQMAEMMDKGNRDQFAAYKAMSMAAAAINTAMAIGGMLAQTKTLGWAAMPLAVVAGVLGAAQVAIIGAQSYEGRELGGPVTAGKPYIVGEKRAEVFVPNQSGRIIPQTGEKSTNVTVVNQISAGVLETTRAEIGRYIPAIVAQSVNAVRLAMRSGELQRA